MRGSIRDLTPASIPRRAVLLTALFAPNPTPSPNPTTRSVSGAPPAPPGQPGMDPQLMLSAVEVMLRA